MPAAEITDNVEFLSTWGRPGAIGLIGGGLPIDRAIRYVQKGLTGTGQPSLWSHALIFEGKRVDGQVWVIESDMDMRKGFARFGVQENRVDKYESAKHYPNVAVLDFGLSTKEAQTVLTLALDFVSQGTPYAVGGIFKTYAAILRKQFWKQKEKDSTFCSSFVRTLYHAVQRDLSPGIAIRHTTIEHLAQTELPHRRKELVREPVAKAV
jgi:hypothetical protein